MRRLGPPPTGNDCDPAHVLVPGARLYRHHTGSELDWPAKTVKAGVHGPPGGEHIVIFDDGSFRYLTVRECAALQGFPDDYVLPMYRTQAMRLLGNAVPVTLAQAIGAQLAKTLGHEPKQEAGAPNGFSWKSVHQRAVRDLPSGELIHGNIPDRVTADR